MKHAKGPWQSDTDYWVKDSEGTLLASVGTSWRSKEVIFATRDLISAAPEMLAALERAHLQIIELLNEGNFNREITLDLGYIVDAIAKAEGRDDAT